MAGALDRLGRFGQAEAHYRSALDLSPDDPKVWNDAGYSYYLQHRLADAERSLKTAAKFDPNNPRIQTNLGLALAAAGKTDEALAALSKAGGPAAGNANLAYLLASLGKTDEARKHYQTALRLQPQLAPAREALARLDAQDDPVDAVGHDPQPDRGHDRQRHPTRRDARGQRSRFDEIRRAPEREIDRTNGEERRHPLSCSPGTRKRGGALMAPGPRPRLGVERRMGLRIFRYVKRDGFEAVSPGVSTSMIVPAIGA